MHYRKTWLLAKIHDSGAFIRRKTTEITPNIGAGTLGAPALLIWSVPSTS